MGLSNIGYVNDRFGNEPGKVPIYAWNPGGYGCSQKCECCWARKMARRMKCPDCRAFKVHLHLERLDWPSKKKERGLILPNYGCDTFDELRPSKDIVAILYEAHRADQHIYAWLTQNPHVVCSFPNDKAPPYSENFAYHKNWYLGLTIRSQAEADERVNSFTEIPGKLWLSLEPLWSSLDLTCVKTHTWKHKGPNFPELIGTEFSALMNALSPPEPNPPPPGGKVIVPARTWNISGVIVGHDSRKGAPGTDTLDHIRSVVEQCKAAGVPVYVKQIWVSYFYFPPGMKYGRGRRKLKFLRASHPDEYALYPSDLKLRDLPWDGAIGEATDGETAAN